MVDSRNRNLIERNGVWHFRKQVKGQKICFSLNTGSVAKARQKRKEILKNIQIYGSVKEPQNEEVPVFGELAVQWFDIKKRNLKKATRRDYQYSLNSFLLPKFGNIPINQIEYLDIEMYIAGLEKKNKRIANLLIPMRNIFRLALKASYIEKNPMDLLDPIKVEKPDIDPFSFEDAQTIINSIESFYKDFATVMFYSGMRFSEASALRWKNVDFKLGVIKIREALVEGEINTPKTDSSTRDIKMMPMVVEAFRNQRKATWGRSEFVFLNMAGRNLKPTPFNQKIWKKACSMAGIEYKPVKHTRSTYITLMLDAGEHVGWVARQVGHSSFKMIYDHYYSYIKNYQTDDGQKFMERVYAAQKESPEKVVTKLLHPSGLKV